MYLTTDEIKKHLNIDYNDDDAYLADLIDAAEDYVATYTNRPIYELTDGSDLRPMVKHAVKLIVGNWYANRESVTFATPSELPYGVAAILVPLKKY